MSVLRWLLSQLPIFDMPLLALDPVVGSLRSEGSCHMYEADEDSHQLFELRQH